MNNKSNNSAKSKLCKYLKIKKYDTSSIYIKKNFVKYLSFLQLIFTQNDNACRLARTVSVKKIKTGNKDLVCLSVYS